MENFYLSDAEPETYPTPNRKLVDEFGQWKNHSWPGKITSLDELRKTMDQNLGPAAYPFPSWNRWGGDSNRKLKNGTGFFSTFKTPDGRWHLTDPDGCDYFSLGPCGTRAGEEGRIDAFEKNCDWLPEKEDPIYGEYFREDTMRRSAYMEPEHFRMFNFCGANLKKVYGSDWKEKWEEMSHHILMSSGINSQGNFPGLCVNDGRTKIPYVRELRGFPSTETLIFRDFPDVLSEEYAENSWGSSFDSFDALQNPIEKCSEEYPGSFDDIREYSRFLVREYIRIPSEACRKTDRNHLNLGLRWSKADNPDMMVGWEYFDVFSINCYDFDPSTDMDFTKNAGVDLPILLGEYHCGALDRGLPATGLKGVENQTERAKMWRYYVEHAAAHPYGVGAHWFQYNDQFCLGRFDGENYQIGMVDVCMQPYPELMEAVKKSSEALYAVKNGEQEPFDEELVSIPMIGY